MTDDLRELETRIRSCSRCADILSKHPEDAPPAPLVRARPIQSDPHAAQIMLIGQAPGITEYRTGKPFSGGAGQGIRDHLRKLGLGSLDFDSIIYQTSIVKCFPGRKRGSKGQWEDRVPCAAMKNNCRPFLCAQVDLLKPKLIITLGLFAANALQRLRGLPVGKLKDFLGQIESWNGARICYLPHTSGNNRFFNDPKNRSLFDDALSLLAQEINQVVGRSSTKR